jgi:molybdopterin molybdotransferase
MVQTRAGSAAAPQRLTPPDAALAALRAAIAGPVAPRRLPAAEAVGHVLAAPLAAAAAVPDRPAAARDGWAVAAADTLGAGPYAPAPLPAPPARVAPGEAMPAGTDAVLLPFDLDAEGPLPQALTALAPGEGVRRPGEEIAAGTLLRAAGERLVARDLPALAALGIAEVAVRVPRLAWIAGDPAGAALHPFVAALARAEGAVLQAGPPPCARRPRTATWSSSRRAPAKPQRRARPPPSPPPAGCSSAGSAPARA